MLMTMIPPSVLLIVLNVYDFNDDGIKLNSFRFVVSNAHESKIGGNVFSQCLFIIDINEINGHASYMHKFNISVFLMSMTEFCCQCNFTFILWCKQNETSKPPLNTFSNISAHILYAWL